MGPEQVVNGDFSEDATWTKVGTSISGGKLIFGSGTTYATQITLQIGKKYRFTFSVLDYSSASLGLSSISITPSFLVTSVGEFSVDATAISTELRLVSTGGLGNSIGRISVREVLN